MKALIRNCRHGGDIYLIEEITSKGKVKAIFKSSATLAGIENLQKEIRGFDWYNQHVSKGIETTIVKETDHYLHVKYEFIKGKKYSFKKGYYQNRDAISIALHHYCTVWNPSTKENSLSALHGDLSLDNIIFTQSGVIIVDWEHFSPNAAPLGFDALYLLFESLWFESGNNIPKSKTLNHLADMIKLLVVKNCLNLEFIENPLEKTIRFIEDHSFLWGEQYYRNPTKLPVLQFNHDLVRSIDLRLNG